MMPPSDLPPRMPSTAQRALAFAGFLAYIVTQAQLDAHKEHRRLQALEATRANTPRTLDDWADKPHHATGPLHDATPHIHEHATTDLARWPHKHGTFEPHSHDG